MAFAKNYLTFKKHGRPNTCQNDDEKAAKIMNTVSIRIVAAATINFIPSSVRLLIEGGSYSRATTIHFAHACAMIVMAARA